MFKNSENKAPQSKLICVLFKNRRKLIGWLHDILPIYWLMMLAVLLLISLIILPQVFWNNFLYQLKSRGFLMVLLVAFALVAISLVWSVGQRLDAWFFNLLNIRGYHPAWLDTIMLYYTQLGTGVAGLLLAAILFFTGNHLLAYGCVLGTLSLWFVVEVIKVLIHRRRPYIRLANSRIVGAPAAGYSFPSGHTSQSFFIAVLMSQYFQFGFLGSLLMYGLALLVGITRIYVGMHYPRDVLGGMILGTAWGILTLLISVSF